MFIGVSRVVLLLVSCTVALASVTSHAQPYPNRPVRIVMAFPPGGTADALLRPLAAKLGERLGQPVVIDSKPGANGNVGTEIVAKAPPDGYTLILGGIGPFATNSALYPMAFDPVKDFVPVTLLAFIPNVLVVDQATAFNSVADVVAEAKRNPGKLSYGSSGAGSSNQLAAELFKQTAGVDIVHVPYKGGAPAQVDIMGGRLTMMFDSMPAASPLVQSKKLKALAVTSRARQPSMPEVPTMLELGYPNFVTASWFGILAPAGTPPDIVAILNREIVAAMALPELRERYASQGLDVSTGTADQFKAFMAAETAKWHRVMKEAGIKAD